MEDEILETGVEPTETPATTPETPAATETEEIRDPAALKRSLDAAREDAKKAKQRARELEQSVTQQKQTTQTLEAQIKELTTKFGSVDLTRVAELERIAKEKSDQERIAEENKLVAQGQLEQIRKQYQDELNSSKSEFTKVRDELTQRVQKAETEKTTEVQTLQQQIEDLQKSLKTRDVERHFSKAFKKAGGSDTYEDMLLEKALPSLEYESEAKIVKVKTADGKADRQTDEGDFTLDNLMVEYKTKYPDMFLSNKTGAGGGKAPNSNDKPATAKPKTIQSSQLSNLAAIGVTLEDIRTGKVLVV